MTWRKKWGAYAVTRCLAKAEFPVHSHLASKLIVWRCQIYSKKLGLKSERTKVNSRAQCTKCVMPRFQRLVRLQILSKIRRAALSSGALNNALRLCQWRAWCPTDQSQAEDDCRMKTQTSLEHTNNRPQRVKSAIETKMQRENVSRVVLTRVEHTPNMRAAKMAYARNSIPAQDESKLPRLTLTVCDV